MEPAHLIIALAELCSVVFVVLNAQGRRLVSFPVLFVGVWAAFVFPRLWELQTTPNDFAQFFRDNGTVLRMSIFSILCIGAGLLGFKLTAKHQAGEVKPSADITLSAIDEQRVFFAGLATMAISYVGVFAMTRVAGGFEAFYLQAGSYQIEWRGAVVYFVFVANFIYLSLVLFSFLWFRFKRPKYLFCLVISLFYPLANILYLFRRSDTLFIMMILGYGAICWGNKKIGRGLAALGVGTLIFVVLAFPVLRSTLNSDSKLSSSMLASEATQNSRFSNNTEMAASAYNFYQIDALGQYQFGAIIWNSVVNQFVPRQIVGSEIKDSLLLNQNAEEAYVAGYSNAEYYYLAPMGFTQAYQQFALLGFVVFLAFGLLVGFLENWAFVSLRAEVLYVVTLPTLILAVSNDISIVLPRLIYYGLASMIIPAVITGATKVRHPSGKVAEPRFPVGHNSAAAPRYMSEPPHRRDA